MFSFLQKKVYPIGIDLGSFSLKMIQLGIEDGNVKLLAAAKENVPADIQGNPSSIYQWYVENIRRLLDSQPFKGKKVVTALPSREMQVQHLRVPKMDPDQLKQALPFEAQDKLPFDINGGLLRHVIAGEIYDGDETKLEVVVMAASGVVIRRHLQLLEQLKVESERIDVESGALMNCFSYLFDSAESLSGAVMLVDLGHSCIKVMMAHDRQIVFCRTISISPEAFGQAMSEKVSQGHVGEGQSQQSFGIAQDQEHKQAQEVGDGEDKNIVENSTATVVLTEQEESENHGGKAIDSTNGTIIQKLTDELRNCVRYHDLMFAGRLVEKVIFVGGRSKDKMLCQRLAQGLSLSARIGDPMARLTRREDSDSQIGMEADAINSDWAVAFGLSLQNKT